MEKKTWVRVGLNGRKIRAGDPCGWRCFFGDDPAEVPMKAIRISGNADSNNWMTGTSAAQDRNGLVGWFQCYGTCTIDNGVLYITLETPHIPPPLHQAIP